MRTCWFVGHLIFGSDQYNTLVHTNELLLYLIFLFLPFDYTHYKYAPITSNIVDNRIAKVRQNHIVYVKKSLFVCFNCHIYYIISVDLVTVLFIRSGSEYVCVTAIELDSKIIML